MSALSLLLLLVGPSRLDHMPEPLVVESLTDIDGIEAGEVEIDSTGLLAQHFWSASAEIEWRALSHLGLGVEVGGDEDGAGIHLGASVPLLHAGLHLMLEGSARLPDTAGEIEPGETALPYALGFRAGVRFGRLTLRGAADAEWSSERASMFASGATLISFGSEWRGFAGIELAVDGARTDEVAVIPEAAYLFGFVRLGIAVPITSDAVAGMVRIIFELDAD
jgi:hypothetical protein